MDCPVCKKAMQVQKDEGVTIDVCAEHGVWLDQGELFQITEAKRHHEGGITVLLKDVVRRRQEPARDDERRLPCPKCAADMRLELYEDVQFDWCPKHGIFLDLGELEAIENNLRLDPVFLRGVALRLKDAQY